MKKTIRFISFAMLSAAVAAFAVSCNHEPEVTGEGNVTFVISPEGGNAVTKATTAVISGSKESQMTDVVVLAFRNNVLAAAPVTGTSSVTMTLPYGTYDIYAVANTGGFTGGGLKTAAQWAAVTSPSSITSIPVPYADYNDGTDFIQIGHKSVDVNAASVSESISTTRLVSRIRFQSIKNSMPEGIGTLTLQRIFLCNVAAGSVTLGEDVSSATTEWYNPFGRPKDNVGNDNATIDGSTYVADNAALTYKAVSNVIATGATAGSSGSPLALFYPYPNNHTNFSAEAWKGQHTPVAQATCICVAGTVSGQGGTKTYYWTFKMPNGLEVNKSYDVNLTITKLGADEPGEMKDGVVSVSVVPAEWGAGSNVTEIL